MIKFLRPLQIHWINDTALPIRDQRYMLIMETDEPDLSMNRKSTIYRVDGILRLDGDLVDQLEDFKYSLTRMIESVKRKYVREKESQRVLGHRRTALAKLTPDELRALGIDERGDT